MAVDASIALTTVSDVELALGLTPGTLVGNTFVEFLINSMSEMAATYLGRPLGFAEDITERPRAYGWQKLRVNRTPIFQVTSVKVYTVTLSSTPDDDYIIEDEGKTGIIYLKWVAPYSGSRMGRTITQDWLVDTEAQDPLVAEIVYDGGWALPNQSGLPVGVVPLPLDIRYAVTLAVISAYQRRGRDLDVKSESLMSHSVTFMTNSGFNSDGPLLIPGWPIEAAGPLARYRRIPQY